MELEKYKRWPFVIIDDKGRVWTRCKTKGWFELADEDNKGHFKHTKFLTDPYFKDATKVTKHNFKGFNISIKKL